MNVRIQWNYRSLVGKKRTLFTSDPVSAQDALIFAADIEKTGRAVQPPEFVADNGDIWTRKELEKLLKKVETEPHDIIAYFDGGYDRARRMAGLGVVIYFEQDGSKYRIRKNEAVPSIDSNNEAEYAALWLLLRELELLGAHHTSVIIRGDSQVVFNQLTGDWPVYEEEENRWLDRIEAKLSELDLTPKYEPLPRTENKEADMLAGQALAGECIQSRKRLDIHE
ncbi:reverse transcriptase-like protein [Aneurinibacillus uraniidurans]|uniref:reverse transcriptase-like protein n=1 Tax=Aneurinibacillus uraniidurans TaxID=2966586 RepID=UPI00234B06B6|nr:reverse transcriptase-like protein [Aneurinibacillus sp. B1]WCN39469.1 reverse transcriptase-like protein [Aneurinibacillus sp. B1]